MTSKDHRVESRGSRRLHSIEWVDDTLRVIDQSCLPEKLVYLSIRTINEVYHFLRTGKIQGAPLTAVAIAYGLYLGIRDFPQQRSVDDFMAYFDKNTRYLMRALSEAAGAHWAIDRMVSVVQTLSKEAGIEKIKTAVLAEANRFLFEDKITCTRIGEAGCRILRDGGAILTHGSGGVLTSASCGTALAPVYEAAGKGMRMHVYICESRPTLAGARLTAFELVHAAIPATLICDGVAAALMRQKKIDSVIVGAEMMAANADAICATGVYGLAVLARAHAIPFYTAVPYSRIDIRLPGVGEVPIEQLDSHIAIEWLRAGSVTQGTEYYTPQFDVIPHEFLTGAITETGLLSPPFDSAIRAAMPDSIAA